MLTCSRSALSPDPLSSPPMAPFYSLSPALLSLLILRRGSYLLFVLSYHIFIFSTPLISSHPRSHHIPS